MKRDKGESMTRLVMIALLTAFVVLGVLGVTFLKDSYKLLPIYASKEGEPGQFSSWSEFQAPNGKFHVMMPGIPQNATQNIKDPKTKELRHYDMYVAQKNNGSIFMVSLIKFPEPHAAPEMLQKTVVNDLLAANPQNQLKSMKVGSYKDYKTLDYSIVNNDMTVQGMTFVDGNTLYLVSTVFPNQYYNAEEYEHFIKSFELGERPLGTPELPK